MNLNEVLRRLDKVEQTGKNQYMAICPAHDDSSPSLAVSCDDEGKILLKCFRGCETPDICKAIGIRISDLFPKKEQTVKKVLIAEYMYYDADGNLVGKKSKYKGSDGKKYFTQYRKTESGWSAGLQDFKMPLYNIRALDINPLDDVLIPEGEKDVDTLTTLGYCAVSNSSGASEKWKDYHIEPLRDRDVYILTDNDKPGISRGKNLAKALLGIASSVKIISCKDLWDEAPEKADVTDVLEKFGVAETKSRLENAIFTAEDVTEDDFKEDIVLAEPNEIILVRDDKDRPIATISNFVEILTKDGKFGNIMFNQLLNAPEIHTEKSTRRWSDTDLSYTREYIQNTYKLYHKDHLTDALNILFDKRKYHPVKDIIEQIKWDGQPRIEDFLIKWAKVEDTAYGREVSRLIFAGGIWRLYQPGCKFDDVPVLVGTHQGEGKSSLVRWLAINDSFYGEAKVIDGKESIEQLEGCWILEFSELLALTRVKEQEAVKSYITTQRDKMRKPFKVNPEEFPRQCIFIGTTNNRQFLSDLSGNRRFYPIEVQCNGYDLYDNEKVIRDYIIQCWGEAKARYDNGNFPNYADRKLKADYEKHQEEAMQDDWRVGVIGEYLKKLPLDHRLCIKEISERALDLKENGDSVKKSAKEIGQILNRYFTEWECGDLMWTNGYGTQRCWIRKKGATNDEEELEF